MGVESSDPANVEGRGEDLLGAPIERREDRPLITGDAEYTDDV